MDARSTETDGPEGPVERLLAQTWRSEARLVGSLATDLGPDLHLADKAAALLLATLLEAQPEAMTGQVGLDADGAMSGDVGELNRSAQLFIGIRGWRVMRASRAVLAAGYEVEARALDRIILELVVHRAAILEDPSGEEARAWLNGERGWRISKRVAEMTKDDLYKNMSHDSHGDPVAVRRLFNAESNSLIVSPTRSHASRVSLLFHAGFARDQALIVAQAASLGIGGLEAFDEEVAERWRVLATRDYANADGQTTTSAGDA
jgi:hypothetical protein